MEKPLYWHQGLFLQPQHFQLQDRFTRSLFEPLHHKLTPHFWGVASMAVKSAALGNRSIGLTRGEFLFPDMTYAVLPDNAVIQSRSFESAWEDGGKPFMVYIGVKKFSPVGENVTVVADMNDIKSVKTRFVTTEEADETKDLHGNGPSAQIRHLMIVLNFFWESEKDQLGDYELIPLTRLERQGDAVVLSPQYIPPCLDLGAVPALEQLVKEVRDQIAARGRQLEAYKRDRGIHSAEFGSRDMVFLLALRSLNRYIARLIHLTEARQVHPWSAYGVLRQLIGEMTTFSERVSVAGMLDDGTALIPPYRHEALWPCFSAAQTLITQLLDEITAGPEYMLQLLFDGTYFATELPPAIFEGRNRFYLALDTETDPQQVLSSVEKIAKFSSREYLPILIARALPGVRLTYLQVPPQELPRRANTLYFQIDHHGDAWAQVQHTNNLALYWDAAPEDLKAELMAVGRS
ncbi:Type VI secretion protein, VC_A0114 family [Desulfosarcina cetonica]|uniref:type VI secretion system baseplate subunit TssK n=1 Tax=Desulfosarcina cetonica TaxID=90730 RepID=UPI0006D229E1|nr:type VI secretion system baseplate subunit TssK [Desulfosarcina cetonica]VTR64252.1 Type VI secretion protein, VC_A0114 family [Desulfosarcina cetonica]